MKPFKDLRRSTDHTIIAGVCGGLAEWIGWTPWTMRLIFIIGSFIPVIPGFVVYIILWIVLPVKQK